MLPSPAWPNDAQAELLLQLAHDLEQLRHATPRHDDVVIDLEQACRA
jgi:hypothetical protein